MGKLLDELKRRKVFRVAAVYAVVAWVLIQVSDVVLPTFGAPGWVNQTIIFLFILGFFPTLIGVWVTRRESPDTSQFDTPVPAFEGSDAVVSVDGTFDISADGSRLLLQRETEAIEETEVTLLVAVENWFEELKRLAPPD